MAIDLSQFVTAFAVSVSSLNALFSSAVSSGSLIVASIGQFANAGSALSNVVDNVNSGNYTLGIFSSMSNAADTQVHVYVAYKLNISSGVAGASTYRVSVNSSAASESMSICAMQYTGGPFTAGSTLTGQGTSSSPAPGATTASSTPAVWVSAAVHNSTMVINSTINTGKWIATVDPTNSGQVHVVGCSTNSSLTQNPTFSFATSTRWTAVSIIFTGQGAGGAVARPFVDGFPLFGCV